MLSVYIVRRFKIACNEIKQKWARKILFQSKTPTLIILLATDSTSCHFISHKRELKIFQIYEYLMFLIMKYQQQMCKNKLQSQY